ncbi:MULTISPECIES: hypothetical protein [Porphyromonadaceae]|uniref:Uncharacterized protein n=2 Tax=Porphyromonadaceae TaxID=171551 RepID=A0AB34R9I6_9PORP|nr:MULTISPECIES: hypothetical protein [Porphyromonadaceae]KIO46475.1 hypothetical protein IE90_03710 [Sanguibacteroides justesenii]MCR9013357.1 hypothetical protein [Gabonibacter chumensis]
MENQEEKQWNSMNDLLSKIGSQLNILEEEIDVDIQHTYMGMLEKLLKNEKSFKSLCKRAQEKTDRLFDETVDEKEKQQMLIALATIDDIAIYRTIETFQKQDSKLKKWATVALQQSRMLIQSTLMDESTVYVSTGLGGQGSLLRYFCVYLANDNTLLKSFQYDIARKETELVITKAQGKIEEYAFFDKYITFTLLLPIEAELKEIFESIIDECNTYGHFLKENIIITNVKKLTPQEIDHFLDTQAQKQNPAQPL